MEEYAVAKCRMQNLMRTGGSFWVHQTIPQEFGHLLKTNYQTYGTDPRVESSTDRTHLKLGEKIETILPIRYRSLGDHESENVLAAWIICKKFGIGPEQFVAALETFKKPAHRIEFVASLNGVDFVNDS
jgi:UDP-N-acetylmuramoylalanine--D-glutamate ligase